MLGKIQYLCLRVPATRFLSTSSVNNRRLRNNNPPPKTNPGLSRRLKMIKEDEADVIEKSEISLDEIEGLEEDIMQAGEIGDDILSDIERRKKVTAYKIIEKKYFKPPKEPNMLTWSEKEQIRNLHENEPEKWTPITLAESFPTSPDIVKKIVKQKWKPASPERILKHDKTVSYNWIAFHQGKLTIHNDRLRVHLQKFTDRKNGVRVASLEEAKKSTEIVMQRPKRTEFLSLITSFKTEDKTETTETGKNRLEEHSQNIKLLNEPRNLTIVDRSKANYTLNQLRFRVKDELETMPNPPDELKALIGVKNTASEITNSSKVDYVAPSERFQPDAVVYQRRNKSEMELQNFSDSPHRIKIPKEIRKSGQIYRVDDSFYSDDGQFLYRVPGLKP